MPATPTSFAPALAPAFSRVLSELRWHRRSVAAGLALLAVVLAGRALLAPGGATTPLLVAARDLPAGTTLAPTDLRIVDAPAGLVPDGAPDPAHPPTGRVVALPLPRGEPITDLDLLGTSLIGALGLDQVAAPLRLADASSVGVVRSGDLVDVLAAGEVGAGRLVASSARVLVAPTDDREPVVVVAVTSSTSLTLAGTAAVARLSLVIRGP